VWPVIKSFAELEKLLKANKYTLTLNQDKAIDQNYIRTYQDEYTTKGHLTASPFVYSFFDYRENSNSIVLDSEILMFINEYVVVWRKSNGKSKETILTVVPITYTEYSRLMSKPYKRPLNYQAWRILDNSSNELSSVDNPVKRAELVVGPNDTITDYVIRYIKRPRAIRLIDFDDVTLDGESTEQTCELDPILHQEILQRAVELAKASYTGDLNSQIALGSSSQTNVGAVAAQSSR
jgi:hypothetical protein